MVHRAAATDYKGNTYMVQKHPQEFSSPGGGNPAHFAPWAEDDVGTSYTLSSGGSYVEVHQPFALSPANVLPYNGPLADSHAYQESMPSIFAYKPRFSGKDYNEYPHILPPGGKSIEQLQQEADLRIRKFYFDSRENQRMVAEKIKKLTDTYGYGTIGYPGYRSSIKYAPIDLGTHNAIDLGTTLDGANGNLRLPLQTVTVTKTIGVRVPQPYPVRQEVPVPAPFPVPVTDPLFESVHAGKEVKYLGAFDKEETKTGVAATKSYPDLDAYPKTQTSSPSNIYRF